MEDNKAGVLEEATCPFAPFLLTTLLKEGGKRQFVIDKWEGTFTWIGHKASEEEIEKFMGGGEERNS